MQFQVVEIKEKDAGKRLDVFMTEFLEQSRSSIQKLISTNNLHINKKQPKKSGVKLSIGDKVAYRLPVKISKHEAEEIPLDIIFEDKNMLVINKAAGIVVHPDNSGHAKGTIVNAALAHCKKLSTVDKARPGIVHRLDKDTSGVLIIAKNDKTHEKLSSLFKDRKVKKTYLALVKGHPKTKEGRIEAPIKRDSKHRKQMAVSKQGKNAISTFKVKEVYEKMSLLEVQIETGRTHQIRVHMASIGHPVAGDEKYGCKRVNKTMKKLGLTRQFLHAKNLKITGKSFTAPLPKNLKKILKEI